MRIATWNVNGLRARIDYIGHWLKSREPDVVGMQELKVTDDEFPHEPFNDLGYTVITHGQKGWNGVAIASRLPIEATDLGLPGEAEAGARLIRGRIAGPGGIGEVGFATAYCPNGKDVGHADFPVKLKWYDSLRDYLAGVDGGGPFLLGGDFNVVPEPVDCWRGEAANGTIFCTAEERSRYQALLDCGLVDLYRRVEPESQAFSWWDYRGGAFHRGMGLRIDMLLGNEALAARVKDVVIDREYRYKKEGLTSSDHVPVYADLD